MRRALLLAVLAMPALARPQSIASGAIQFSKGANGDDLIHGPYINVDECSSGTTIVNLSWNTALNTGATWPASAKYTVYASNKQHPGASATGGASNCTGAADNQGTFAGPVGSTFPATSQTQNLVQYNTSLFVAAVTNPSLNCNVTADTPIYVCVQAVDANSNANVGYALGTLTLSTSRPGAPTGVTAVPADDGALQISWSAPSSTAYDYVLSADGTPTDKTVHSATDIRALSYLMKGLTNNVTYTIKVFARSQAGNQSLTPGTTTGTPVRVFNFWDVYHEAYRGQEQGGCSSGAAGPAALLAVAALVAKLRRRA